MSGTYQLEITPHREYLACRVTGQESAANTQEYWMRILSATKDYQLTKVLVIEDLQGDPEADEVINFVEDTGSDFWGLQIAFVDRHPEDQKDNEFIIYFAQNRGLQIRAFADEEEALTWLLR